MTRKNHLCLGLLCIGLALALSSPSMAGWGSYGGGSFGSGGSGGSVGSSHGSIGWGGSRGSSSGGSLGSHKLFAKLHASSGGSLGGGSFGGSSGGSFASHRSFRPFARLHGSSGGSSHGSSGGATVVVKAHGSSGGSSHGGSLGSSLGSSHGSSGGSSGGLFHGGLISKLKSMHQTKMSWLRSRGHGSSGGSSHGSSGGGVSHGSSGGGSSHGSHGGGSVISHGSHGSVGSYSYSSPIATSAIVSNVPAPSFAEPAYVGSLVSSSAVFSDPIEAAPATVSDNGTLLVSLPADAQLFVNGQETSSTGLNRQFVSKGLKAGYRYPYTVKAVMNLDGQEVVRTKTVDLRAGETLDLAFDFAMAATTNLTVRVPEGATIELAGAKTKANGVERQFATTKLAQGELWNGYQVVVTLNGVSKTQTIDLRGGEKRTLTFDFEEVASR